MLSSCRHCIEDQIADRKRFESVPLYLSSHGTDASEFVSCWAWGIERQEQGGLQ